MDTCKRHRLTLFVSLALAVGTILGYARLLSCGFTNFDDPEYLLDNQQVTAGLTWSGVKWAFGTGHAANWHPLTWISHMIDCQLFGLNPSGHHAINLLLHTITAILLFLWLQRVTHSPWPSAVVAALFAWHPLHVESVAWASERKDVLSGLFFILTLWAYSEYVKASERAGLKVVESEGRKRSGLACYFLCLGSLTFGLMSKPMLVTTPFVLFLVDFWPLDRFAKPGVARIKRATVLALEKLPMLFLAAIASVVTFMVQRHQGAVASMSLRPLGIRLANWVVSYVRYLEKTFWPTDLCIFYPYPKQWPMTLVAFGLLLVLGVSVVVWLYRRRFPFLLTGWFWFLGMLVPTIGIVQVGQQSMADRYMYLPSIGLFIMLVWGWNALAACVEQTFRNAEKLHVLLKAIRPFSFLAAASALAGCLFCCQAQLRYWRNGETVFRRALDVARNNGEAHDQPSLELVHYNLGTALMDEGRSEESINHFEIVLRNDPSAVQSHINLGCALFHLGRYAEAEQHLTTAVKLDPKPALPHYTLGAILLVQSKIQAGGEELSTAIRLDPACVPKIVKLSPDSAAVRYNLGTCLLMQSRIADAIEQLTAAVKLDGSEPAAHRNLAVALMRQGQADRAILEFVQAVRLLPSDSDLRCDLGLALIEQHRYEEAENQLQAALALKPDDKKAQERLATAKARISHKTIL